MLSVKDLEAWYVKGTTIIKKVSFDLKKNTVIGLLGLNGAGKTTLINTLSGVHSNYKYSTLKYDDKDITFKDACWKSNRYTIFTEEQAFSYWSFNEYLPFIEKVYKKKLNTQRIEELIKGFGFEKYVNYPMKELSTGNKKKVFLITGFALELPLLILDEPLDGLDFLASEFLYQEILRYKKVGSVLMSSHIAESIEKTCDEVMILRNGSLKSYEFETNRDIRELLEGWLDDSN